MDHRIGTISRVCLSLAAVLVWRAGPVHAGGVPESAHSRSLDMRPEFLDYTSLVFQYPHRAGFGDSEAFAFSVSGNELGVGVVASPGDQGFFILAQRNPSFFLTGATFLQAGWGGGWESIQFGLAFRGAHSETGFAQAAMSPGSPPSEFAAIQRERQLEGSAGLGLRGDRMDLDLAVDLIHEDAEEDARTMSLGDTLLVHLEDDDDLSWGVSGRIALRIGESAEVVAVGGWAGPERDLAGTRTDASGTTDETEKRESDRWSGGLAVAFSTRHVDWVAVSAHVRVEEASTARVSSGARRTDSFRLETGSLTVSVRHEVWRDLTVFAGGSARYRVYDTESRTQDGGGSESIHTQRTESLDESFAWGASYRWRNFEFNVAADTTLDIENLFLVLDARLFL
ncbi:MAG: hypothetical protein ACE5G2_01095 [Candidatus Krumholzibacteriia bacterium]